MTPPVLAHARRRFDADVGLQRRFGSAASLAYWNWLLTDAWPDDVELRRLLPVPPYELMARTGGAHSTERSWHERGVHAAGCVFERLLDCGFTPAGRVLDFGCGSGRLLRPWTRFAGELELHGVDVDVEAIDWVRRWLPWVHAAVVEPFPPLPHGDGAFAAVFAFAVFSQIAAPVQRAWLGEIARVLAPGGLLMLTTHGVHCAERFAAGDVEHFPFPPAERVRADLAALRENGELFYPYPVADERSLPSRYRDAGLHGVAFVTPEHVRRHWLARFELVVHHEAPRGFQDEIVLRRHARGGDSPAS